MGSPWQMQCWWTVFTWPRRWSRASACPLRRGARPSYSRQSVGTRQRHPGTLCLWGAPLGHTGSHSLLPHQLGVPPPATARQQLWVLGTSGRAGRCPALCPSSQEHPALTAPRGHQPPHSVAGTHQGEGTRFCLLLLHFTGLKNKILSSLFLQVFPSYSR